MCSSDLSATHYDLAAVRHGAPMTLIRGGEERDLAAIVAMGQVRASPFRFHLDRDVDFVRHAIMKRRLLAGFGIAGARQLHFFIAEEGITAAAYVVISVVGDMWTIEECGDRDPSGARVGAILQALIAREPVERRRPTNPRPSARRLRASPGHDRVGEAVGTGDDGPNSRIHGPTPPPIQRGRPLLAE